MGKLVSTNADSAKRLVSGSFTATGQSSAALDSAGASRQPDFTGYFNMQLSGTWVGQVQLENSFDGGVNWNVVSLDATGAKAVYTGNVNTSVFEPEIGVLYRWNCTNYTSGTINYRISQ